MQSVLKSNNSSILRWVHAADQKIRSIYNGNSERTEFRRKRARKELIKSMENQKTLELYNFVVHHQEDEDDEEIEIIDMVDGHRNYKFVVYSHLRLKELINGLSENLLLFDSRIIDKKYSERTPAENVKFLCILRHYELLFQHYEKM
jgi:hypothetical protein